MPSMTLYIQRVVPSSGDAWEVTSGIAGCKSDRIGALRNRIPSGSNGLILTEDTEGKTLRLDFDGLPQYVDTVTSVVVRHFAAGYKAYLDTEMFVDAVSKGSDSITLSAIFAEQTANVAAWDGPWTRAQMMGAYFEIGITIYSPSPVVAVDWVQVEITYTEASGIVETAQRADALQWWLSTGRLEGSSSLGTVPGCALTRPAVRNGEGCGFLVADGDFLTWRAPGSSSYGAPVDVSEDGDYLIEDGDDQSKFIEVGVHADYLPSGTDEGRVFLQRNYEAGLEINAAIAESGNTSSATVYLRNASVHDVHGVKAWIDAGSKYCAISDDDSTWVTPHTEDAPDVLAWDTIRRGELVAVYLQRTIPAGCQSNPKIPLALYASWDRF
jgi:hypothetical protein